MSKADKLLKRIEFYEKMASSEKPKSDELLKKASFYERFALYSDRGSFLQALAQTPPAESGVPASLAALVKAVQSWIQTSGERQDMLGGQRGLPPSLAPFFTNVQNGSMYKSLDIDQLGKVRYNVAELAAVNKNLRDASTDVRHSWINTVLPAATNTLSLIDKEIAELKEWRDSIPQDKGQESPTEVATDTTPGPAKKPAPPPLPSISREDQQAVFNFAIQEGELMPNPKLQIADGQLGSETRKALEGVKNYFKKKFPQNPRMSDQDAIRAAKVPPRQ